MESEATEAKPGHRQGKVVAGRVCRHVWVGKWKERSRQYDLSTLSLSIALNLRFLEIQTDTLRTAQGRLERETIVQKCYISQ